MQAARLHREVNEMELEGIVSVISSIGFPIVACIFMWRYINTTLKEFTLNMTKNTLMLEKIYERLEKEDK